MPFKIIQTKDDQGLTELSVVPSDWEANGKLFWPQKNVKNRSRLIKDDRSKPSPEWDIIDCVVKRANINTYKEAEREITIMQGHTDTDNDLDANYSQQPMHLNTQRQEMNFDELADFLQNKKTLPILNEVPSTSNNVVISTGKTTENSEILQLCCVDSNSEILGNQRSMLEKMNILYETLKAVIENQKKITQKMALMAVQIDDTNMRIMEKIDQPFNVTLLKDVNPEEKESFKLQQIENLKQLQDFELLIIDKAEKAKVKKILSILCSTAKGNGITCAYKLLDMLFSRNFLCECSWSGGSRGDRSKIALKDHKIMIRFFFDLVNHWDCSFTMEDTEKFFKTILKNSLKRSAMKNLRASVKKTRKAVGQASQTQLHENDQNQANHANVNETENSTNVNETENSSENVDG